MAKQKQDNQLEYTYISYVRIQDVALKTCQKRWMIGRSGERGSGISVLAARHDDDDNDLIALLLQTLSAKLLILNHSLSIFMIIENESKKQLEKKLKMIFRT